MIKELALLSCLLPLAIAIKAGFPTGGPGTHPWMAYLKLVITQPYPFLPLETYCGGAIIGQQWILTAAHCMFDPKSGRALAPQEVIVVTGEYSVANNDWTEAYFSTLNIFVHEFYTSGVFKNDLALLQLSTNMVFDAYRSAIPLALPGEDLLLTQWSQCQLTGWGKEWDADYVGYDQLQYVNVNVVDHATCQQMLNNWDVYQLNQPPQITVFPENICVGTGITGACKGDSGGPMTCIKTAVDPFTGVPISAGHVLLGITSRGTVTCGGAPSVYMSVAQYNGWIMDKVNRFTIVPVVQPPWWG